MPSVQRGPIDFSGDGLVRPITTEICPIINNLDEIIVVWRHWLYTFFNVYRPSTDFFFIADELFFYFFFT